MTRRAGSGPAPRSRRSPHPGCPAASRCAARARACAQQGSTAARNYSGSARWDSDQELGSPQPDRAIRRRISESGPSLALGMGNPPLQGLGALLRSTAAAAAFPAAVLCSTISELHSQVKLASQRKMAREPEPQPLWTLCAGPGVHGSRSCGAAAVRMCTL